jgi:ketosteroid isomerase-like protein
MRTVHTIAVLVAAQLAACEPTPDVTSDIAELEGHLVEIEQLFDEPYAGERSVFDVYLDYFDDDLILFHPEGHTTTGRTAALEFYTSAFTGVTIVSLDYYQPEILLDGDLAVRRYSGTGKGTYGEEQTEFALTNRYIDVLERRDGGDWRIVWHAWYPVAED